MATLNWLGKKAVVNHHQQVPFHLLKDVPELSCGDPGSGNLIVEGDNLFARAPPTSHLLFVTRYNELVAG